MGFISWLSGVLGRSSISLGGEGWCDDPEVLSAWGNYQVRELAFESAVNLIANCISKCEFKTRQNHKPVRGKEWYLWNVEPNQNQSSSAFLQKMIHTLYKKNEVLVVEVNGQLLVADSYERKPFAVYPDVFEKVVVGDWHIERPFYGQEVLFFTLGERNLNQVLEAVYSSYQKLLAYGMKAYQQSRGRKGTLTLDMLGSKDEAKEFELIQERFRRYFEADNAVLPLKNGQKYDEIQSKTYASESTRDIRALVDDVLDFTARGFGIPPTLLRGDIAGIKDALNLFLTACIDPLVDKLQEEINRKRNGYAGMRGGNWLTIDTTAIQHIDILDAAAGIDKLISSGVQSVNDILRLLGQDEIEEDWAEKHFITKNYTELDKLQGGDANA